VCRIEEIAAEKGCTPAQLALTWVLGQGKDIVPIPGTKRRAFLEENIDALRVSLTSDDLSRVDAAAPLGVAAGPRYPEAGMKRVNLQLPLCLVFSHRFSKLRSVIPFTGVPTTITEEGIIMDQAGYEFTAEQNETIRKLAGRMKFVGVYSIVVGILVVLFSILALVGALYLMTQLPSEAGPGLKVQLIVGVLMYFAVAAIQLLTGIWTSAAATQFKLIVTTVGQDIGHLMTALGSLRKLYSLQVTLLIVGLILVAIFLIILLIAILAA